MTRSFGELPKSWCDTRIHLAKEAIVQIAEGTTVIARASSIKGELDTHVEVAGSVLASTVVTSGLC
jgi:hypothetical protein